MMLSRNARRASCGLPLRPLAAAFALALALEATPPSIAAEATRSVQQQPHTAVVDNCDDSGPGSLRDAAQGAADGDVIDLTQVACSTISLSTGAIVIGAADLTLQGPGGHQLMIQGRGDSGDGLIYDLGGGTLKVYGLDFSFGDKYRSDHAAHGGCIYTNGNLAIDDARIYACTVHANTYDAAGGALYAYGFATVTNTDISLCGLTTSGTARGGGVFAHGDVTMAYSSVSGCRNASLYQGLGGGVYAGGALTMKYSTIADNENDEAQFGLGGGVYVKGQTNIFWSTISGNAATVGGGLYLAHNSDGNTALIAESTISGNTAHAAGGIAASMPLQLANSTIAFNRIPRVYTIPLDYSFSAGLSVRTAPITITSSIIANNIAFGIEDDPEDVGGETPIPIDGGHNLIMSSGQPTPADTITDDPALAPLADNGGLTKTHAIFGASPAIDRGDKGFFDTDQRGAGFPRMLGNGVDIGAYEADPDVIFRNGFD